MGIFPNHHHFLHIFRIPTYTSTRTKHHILPISTTAGNTRCLAFSLPLTFLSAATAVLFIFSCWLATAQTFQSIYPDTFPHFRNGIDEHDSLRMITRSREPVVYYNEQQVFEVRESGKHVQGIIRPEIILAEAKEMNEGEGKSRLWFKAEYTVEIPICSEYTTENGGGCIVPRDSEKQIPTSDRANKLVPAIEAVRVSFCTGYAVAGSEEGSGDARGDADWEEKKSWDYVFPQMKNPSEIHTTGEWVFGVDKRPLERWTMVDIPGRAHDTLFRTHMVIPNTPGGRPQWHFLLNTAGVDITADAWNISEEKVTVEVPIEETERGKVETVTMWRWKGRYGGCPGEKDGRGVVLEDANGAGLGASRLSDLHNAGEAAAVAGKQ